MAGFPGFLAGTVKALHGPEQTFFQLNSLSIFQMHRFTQDSTLSYKGGTPSACRALFHALFSTSEPCLPIYIFKSFLLLIPFPPLFPLLSYHALPQLCPALDWVIFTSVSHTIKGALKGRAMSASALGSRYRGNECRSD